MEKVAEKAQAEALSWALPGVEVPPDPLRLRLDIHEDTIVLRSFRDGVTTVKPVSALDLTRAFARKLRISSGVLPLNALWWEMGPEGEEVALWRPPQVWKLALVEEAFQAPRRFRLPMPGLIFICSAGRPPALYAAKKRPAGPGWPICHAPLFNVFRTGATCAGTHKYPDRLEEVPESFMVSFFTKAGDYQGRSRKHPKDLLALWEELDGKLHYPIRDLVPFGTLKGKEES